MNVDNDRDALKRSPARNLLKSLEESQPINAHHPLDQSEASGAGRADSSDPAQESML